MTNNDGHLGHLGQDEVKSRLTGVLLMGKLKSSCPNQKTLQPLKIVQLAQDAQLAHIK